MPTDFPRCETCRHWRATVANTVFTECGLDDGRFLACGDDNRPAALVTRRDFGCVAHEPKEG